MPGNAVNGTADLLTDEQAAAILSVESRTIRLWRKTRGLPYLKLTSKIVRIRRADLDWWMEKRLVQTVA